LKLARGLRRLAERGAVVLLVDGDIQPGDPPRVVPKLLAGVAPVAGAAPDQSARAVPAAPDDRQVAIPGPLVR
jgi:hypothetical protein